MRHPEVTRYQPNHDQISNVTQRPSGVGPLIQADSKNSIMFLKFEYFFCRLLNEQRFVLVTWTVLLL